MAHAISTETPRASKQHTCDACGLPIPPGEHYHRSFVVDDGRGYSMKDHKVCVAILRQFCDDGVEQFGLGGVLRELDLEEIEAVPWGEIQQQVLDLWHHFNQED